MAGGGAGVGKSWSSSTEKYPGEKYCLTAYIYFNTNLISIIIQIDPNPNFMSNAT